MTRIVGPVYRRFGPPRAVARRFGPAVPRAEFVSALARALVPTAAAGLVAVGASGLIAEVLGRVFGAAFVSGDPPSVRYTPARCAEFREYYPGHGCATAAALHHTHEVVAYRVIPGVLGLLVLGAWLLARRRGRHGRLILPPGLVAVAGVTLYGAAAVVLLSLGLNATMLGGGGGQWWSAAAVALACAAAYGRSAWRALLATAL